jgi:histidinol-phosphate aminotransferase
VREPFNVNLLAQVAAVAALDDKAHLKKTLAMTDAGRRALGAELKKMGLRVIETATNFIMTDLGRDAGVVYEALLRKGVIVRPMGVWGLKNFVRVTIGKPSENKRFISELKQALRTQN